MCFLSYIIPHQLSHPLKRCLILHKPWDGNYLVLVIFVQHLTPEYHWGTQTLLQCKHSVYEYTICFLLIFTNTFFKALQHNILSHVSIIALSEELASDLGKCFDKTIPSNRGLSRACFN